MIDRTQLLADLQALLRKLEADLLERSSNVLEVKEVLRSDYEQAKDAERTAQSYEEWRSDAITQMASAWVLSGVFVRFLEDNQLIDPPKIAGLGERLQRARDEHELYFRQHPQNTDRDYWLMVFDQLAKLPGAREIFGDNNRIRELPNWLSGDAAGELLRFFQRVEPETGSLVHDFTDENWDTRFLGDLYQDLSEEAQEKFALKQTPEFVESFILDRTLEPALDEFQLEFQRQEFRMIDPACGSGHFLLGSFHRLLDRWIKKEPATSIGELVLRSLKSVHGVDINPYAVAIARFRLLLAAMKTSGINRLRDAPAYQIQVVCGDSLLHGEGTQLAFEGVSPKIHYYKSEDLAGLNRVLVRGHYHAVIANPPYITPKDSAANKAYRKLYKESCYRQYSLAVPFMQRIYSLAVPEGFTGQITANSFMKREFGKKLIEYFIPKIDLTHVIDTSGASIPGHNTPTVILFGRNRKPIASTIRAVMGIKGALERQDNLSEGIVWSAILKQIDYPGSQSEYISVADQVRESFHKHPWSLGGGGASDLKEWLEKNSPHRLLNLIEPPIGRAVRIGEEEAFIFNSSRRNNSLCSSSEFRGYLVGKNLRDWTSEINTWVWYPYTDIGKNSDMVRQLWGWRTTLANRATFQGLMADAGLAWFDYMQHTSSAYKTPLSISFAFVASHNHFVLDRGGKVFKQSAPVIKLPADATEDDHLALLGLLNSSTVCFWMKQVTQIKTQTTGMDSAAWQLRREFDGTKLKNLPIAERQPIELAKKLDQLALELQASTPSQGINSNYNCWLKILRQMIAFQEELDWQCYQLYGLIDENLTHPTPPSISLGQRAFEIVMARKMVLGELQTTWFERHNSTPITELPSEWSDDYKQLVQQRIELIESNKNIALIEQPEYKRRWITEPWDSQLELALRGWLCDRLETYFDFDGRMNEERKPTSKIEIALVSIAQLTDLARHDPEFLQVGELYRKDAAFDVLKLVAELVEAESVPLLPVLRYKPSGFRKRAEWEHTWSLQRLEDAMDARTKLPKEHPDYVPEFLVKQVKRQEVGDISVPPKYTSSDFQKSHYWKLRGELDVQKERWISFPHCNAEDGTVMIAWAGYNHLQLAQAISTYFITVKEELGGRNDSRLPPLLASLIELLPWLKQWHNDLDPTYNLVMSDYFESFIQDEARDMGKTLDEVSAWQPPAKTGRRR